jgi:hypothetical protein
MATSNTIVPMRQFWYFPVAISISKANANGRNVESLNAPCKPYFWLAQIRELSRSIKRFPVCRETIDKGGWIPHILM